MIVDGHVHIWQRKMLPDSMLRAYLEPLLALDGLVMDLAIDREQDWPMSQVNSEQLLQSMQEAKVDRAVVLPLDFGLVDAPEVGIEQYNDWVFECCRNDDKLIPFIGIDPMRGKVAEETVRKYVKALRCQRCKGLSWNRVFPERG